jgi:hypothetical protein
MTLVILASALLLGAMMVLKDVISALFVQEIKGALADRLERDVSRAAQLIPDDCLAAELHAEWLGELGAAKDRPLKAVSLVRGYRVAARAIAVDLAPVPVSDRGPTGTRRLRAGLAARSESARRARDFRDGTIDLLRDLRMFTDVQDLPTEASLVGGFLALTLLFGSAVALVGAAVLAARIVVALVERILTHLFIRQ